MRPSAIVFDLDGTLLDSAEDILEALKQAVGDHAVELPKDLSCDWIGPPIAEILNRFPGPLSAETKMAVVQSFRGYYDNFPFTQTRPYPQVLTTLETLCLEGVALFGATNKPEVPTKRLVHQWFSNCFVDTISIDSFPGKQLSKTEMVKSLIRKHSLDKASTWVVGDGVGDLQAAIVTQCLPVAVGYGYTSAKVLRENGAKIVLASIDELLTWNGRPD